MVLLSAGRLLMRSGNFQLAYSVAMWKTRDSDSLPRRESLFACKTAPPTYFNVRSFRPLHFCAGNEFNLASKFDKHLCDPFPRQNLISICALSRQPTIPPLLYYFHGVFHLLFLFFFCFPKIPHGRSLAEDLETWGASRFCAGKLPEISTLV